MSSAKMAEVSNYFVEVNPGAGLEGIIRQKKNEVIEFLGPSVIDNPRLSMYFRDPPHFTLIGARTRDLDGLREALRRLALKFNRIDYEIIGVEDNPSSNNLIEVRTVVNEQDRKKFMDLHLAVVEASLPFKSEELYHKWSEANFTNPGHLENLRKYGFHLVGEGYYKPHASIGRVQRDLRPQIEHLVGEQAFDPRGVYQSGDLIIWRLPGPENPTATPSYLETFGLGGE